MVGRRSPGDGSVYQRGDGRWIGAVSLGLDHNGRRLRRTVSAKTKSEVSRRLRKLQSQLEANTVAVDEDITVAKWCRLWLDTTVVNTTKESNWAHIKAPFIIGICLAALGGYLVTKNPPKPTDENPAATEEAK